MTDAELKALNDEAHQKARGMTFEDFEKWFNNTVSEDIARELHQYRKRMRGDIDE